MWQIHQALLFFIFSAFWLPWTTAVQLDVDSPESVKEAATIIAKDMMTFYKGEEPGQIPGSLLKPYYWWQAGALWGELIEYWAMTGDTQYNNLVTKSLLFQVGEDKNYMPANASKEEGNDDQVFWAFSAMTAAELNFPDPPPSQPQWLALAQAVFNSQIKRWDLDSCAGGLRWQIFFTNPGWTYKNTISTGGLFQLSARLGRYTGDKIYLDWAEKTWDWLASTPNLKRDYTVNDGSDVKKNCTDANGIQWTYNYGALLYGSAMMYDHTKGEEREKWKTRVSGLITQLQKRFYPTKSPTGAVLSPNIMVETSCEWVKECNPDQASFKAYLSRWLAGTTQLAPYTRELIMPKLQASAVGAAQQCSGGDTGSKCGRDWNSAKWDGYTGVGEQMSALGAIQATLIDKARKPTTAINGGTSKGDANAGAKKENKPKYKQISLAGKSGAGFLTALLVIGTVGGCWWMIDDGG
ncbi:hypothetical protein BLS_006114 [Venturia inaequalis]|uniref:Mannan endo-1,6-alpha-mannosidase n=1 Tax=Venturia inaequalis TaxID=5025 RepID=A0A8H3USM4_VENIN|nr:hypothetical protein EG328_003732 [Venturia inaequalis]KAE9982419.1 hypothetical protein BLS_006114 [Venturia inaequalis]